MNSLYEIDYEIESIYDEYGDFPLHCATLLFDLLNIHSNIIIKNQYSIKTEKTKIISKYLKNEQNYFYEWPKSPEGNYCIWIKQHFSTNQEFIDILNLQGTYLSYIVPNDSFEWGNFQKRWKEDEWYLFLTGQVSFACNIIDMDRTLNIIFDTTVFSIERITSVVADWEKAITCIAKSTQQKKTVTKMRSKYGNKQLVRLSFL